MLPLKLPQRLWLSTNLDGPKRSALLHKSKVRQGLADFDGLWRNSSWWAHQDSNLGQAGYEPEALPTEL